MLGRFFFIGLVLVGSAAVALFATKSGYNVGQDTDEAGVTCRYWIGFGLYETRHDIAEPSERAGFECPVLLRDIAL